MGIGKQAMLQDTECHVAIKQYIVSKPVFSRT